MAKTASVTTAVTATVVMSMEGTIRYEVWSTLKGLTHGHKT